MPPAAFAAVALGAAALLGIGGCAEIAMRQKERQMELVARDWCMVIRASQVIPLYPLSQDMQPGDVFLVNRTVADQSKRYRERGFLPTDLRVCRLFPTTYGDFYRGRAGEPRDDDPALVLPRAWRDPDDPLKPWERFPAAGFPSYTFQVSNSGGLSIAVPVQSVPIAFSILGAASATGSLTITQCYTYGIDAAAMTALLEQAKREHLLDCVVPPEGEGPWFLRVVTQVFGAKSFDVVLTANSTLGTGADAGAAQPVGDARGSLENGITVTEINEQLSKVGSGRDPTGMPLPGVSARATFASGRSVGMSETFVEPVIFGYQGFDVAIDSHGRIGPLIPTFQVVDGEAIPESPTAFTDEDERYSELLDELRGFEAPKALSILSRAAGNDPVLLAAFERERARGSDAVGAWIVAADGTGIATNRKSKLIAWIAESIRKESGG
ncbi:MAG: hypothetical protein FJ253_05205 [Phycisphaerae bacterium]|nr:hypothetical protein [Phycisphaerae bacterium]